MLPANFLTISNHVFTQNKTVNKKNPAAVNRYFMQIVNICLLIVCMILLEIVQPKETKPKNDILFSVLFQFQYKIS